MSLLPITKRIYASTIGQDLVSVKPLSKASNINYWNITYNEETLRRILLEERQKKIEKIMDRIRKGDK